MSSYQMNQNLTERFIRIVVGGILMLAATYMPMGLIWVWVLTVIGLILMITGLAGYSPVYNALKISTKK